MAQAQDGFTGANRAPDYTDLSRQLGIAVQAVPVSAPFANPATCVEKDIFLHRRRVDGTGPVVITVVHDQSQEQYTACIIFDADPNAMDIVTRNLWHLQIPDFPGAEDLLFTQRGIDSGEAPIYALIPQGTWEADRSEGTVYGMIQPRLQQMKTLPPVLAVKTIERMARLQNSAALVPQRMTL